MATSVTSANSAFIGQQSQSEAARQQSSDNTPDPHPEGATAHQGKVTAKQLREV
jgi:hypothetical protein